MLRRKRQTRDSHRRAREPPGAPGGLEVEAADRTVKVEDFARQIEMGYELALHGARIDFVQGHAARSDLRFLEAERAGQRNRQLLDRADQTPAFLARQGGGLAILDQAGLLEQ